MEVAREVEREGGIYVVRITLSPGGASLGYQGRQVRVSLLGSKYYICVLKDHVCLYVCGGS